MQRIFKKVKKNRRKGDGKDELPEPSIVVIEKGKTLKNEINIILNNINRAIEGNRLV